MFWWLQGCESETDCPQVDEAIYSNDELRDIVQSTNPGQIAADLQTENDADERPAFEELLNEIDMTTYHV